MWECQDGQHHREPNMLVMMSTLSVISLDNRDIRTGNTFISIWSSHPIITVKKQQCRWSWRSCRLLAGEALRSHPSLSLYYTHSHLTYTWYSWLIDPFDPSDRDINLSLKEVRDYVHKSLSMHLFQSFTILFWELFSYLEGVAPQSSMRITWPWPPVDRLCHGLIALRQKETWK